jgi:hypothetical protein
MREAIDRAIEAGTLEEMTGLLEGARTPEIRYTVKQIVRSNGGEEPLIEHAQRWIGRPEPAARHVACGLLVESYKNDPQETFALLLNLADDTDWTVRESAGEACGTILQSDFAKGLETLREWRGHPSENVRRTGLIAPQTDRATPYRPPHYPPPHSWPACVGERSTLHPSWYHL